MSDYSKSKRRRTWSLLLVVGLTTTAGSTVYSQETKPPVLSPRETWSTFFGGQDVRLHYLVFTPIQTPWREWRLGWSLSAEGRTISRGETTLAEGQEEQAAPAVATIQARLPEVRPGGAIELRLSVELLGPGRRELASHERPLWLLSDNPFVDRGRWLEGLKIGLFDPPGRTAAKLRAMGVPFEPIHNLAAIEEHEAKLLVIGEGLSFGRNRPLGEILIRWAEAGGKALCLAPSDGWLTLPGLAPGIEPRRRPQRIVLRGTDVIPELDKRLDALAWPPDGPIVASSLAVAAERNRLEFHVVDDESGWPWVESHYANGGSMLVCGFAIIERWDTGPTPRYLFARMLEEIAEPH